MNNRSSTCISKSNFQLNKDIKTNNLKKNLNKLLNAPRLNVKKCNITNLDETNLFNNEFNHILDYNNSLNQAYIDNQLLINNNSNLECLDEYQSLEQDEPIFNINSSINNVFTELNNSINKSNNYNTNKSKKLNNYWILKINKSSNSNNKSNNKLKYSKNNLR